MAQGEMPEIFGLDWSPSGPLEFVQPLHSDAARQEFLLSKVVDQESDSDNDDADGAIDENFSSNEIFHYDDNVTL